MTATLVRPAYLWVPESTSTAGPEAADLAESVGLSLFGEQRLVLDALLAERDGRWAAFEAVVVTGRQNLKTFDLEIAALYDAFLRRVDRVVWTAHQYKTTADSFASIAALCENFDHLRSRVHRVYSGAGEQRIQLLPRHSGPRIDFMARSSGGGRGLAGDTVTLDEALYLTPMMMGALLPTLSSKPDPQVRYGSSAGLPASQVLRALRDRGRRGGDPSLAYVEWTSDDGDCAERDCAHLVGAAGCLLDDESRWAQANPALGKRISVEYVRNERRALPPAEFARERMGWWEDPPEGGSDAIPAVPWRDCGDRSAAPRGGLVLALDVTPDRGWSAIAAASTGPGGTVPVEVVEHRQGTAWVPDRVAELVARHAPDQPVRLDAGASAGSLIPALTAAGVRVEPVTGRDVVRACGNVYDLVVGGRLRHRDQQSLNSAAVGARRRKSGEAFAFTRADPSADISPLMAVTLAAWAVTSSAAADYDVAASIY